MLINRINASGGGSLPVPPPVGIDPPPYWDVNGDDKLTPADALAVINFINRLRPAGIAAPLGEAEADAASTIFARAVDEVLNARSVDLEAAVRTGSGDGQELPSRLCHVSDDSIPSLELLVRGVSDCLDGRDALGG
jgi:hypothetical protein